MGILLDRLVEMDLVPTTKAAIRPKRANLSTMNPGRTRERDSPHNFSHMQSLWSQFWALRPILESVPRRSKTQRYLAPTLVAPIE
jgi:hypothetical protein